MESELHSSETFENLKKAFFDEASLSFRYGFFAIVADFEGMDNYAKIFKDFAEGGVQNVQGCMDFLRLAADPSSDVPIGSTLKNLESVLQTETQHFSEQYGKMAEAARKEGFMDIASWFDSLEKLKASRAKKLKQVQVGHE